MPEIIRLGDSTSHGGKVLEGSQSDLCHGKPIAFIGHKVSCPKCRGTQVIVEGVPTTTFYGKGVAVAGMKTSCGATLIPSQFTDTVEWASGPAGGNSASTSGPAGTSSTSSTSPAPASAAEGEKGEAPAGAQNHGDAHFDEQSALPERIAEGVPYLIVAPDGRRFSGKTASDGKLPRVSTGDEVEYLVYWGDEALARMEEHPRA